jgi:hypothetical protein
MWVFYYQNTDGRTWCICVRGGFPTIGSPIWKNCNTSAWMVPGTHSPDSTIDEDADQ